MSYINLVLYFIEIELVYTVVLISVAPKSDSLLFIIHIHYKCFVLSVTNLSPGEQSRFFIAPHKCTPPLEGTQARWRPGFDPWVRKILWRRAWQPTPVILLGESPWTKEPGGLQSMGTQRVRHN